MSQKRDDPEGTLRSFDGLLKKSPEIDGSHGPGKWFADSEVMVRGFL